MLMLLLSALALATPTSALVDEIARLGPADRAQLVQELERRGLLTVDPEGLAADQRALEEQADDRLEQGRRALRLGDYEGAIRLMRPLRGTSKREVVVPFLREAIDGHVYLEQERAGRLYLEARRGPRSLRYQAMQEVQLVLAGLLGRFGESAFADGIANHLERVEREMELLPEPSAGPGGGV